MKESGLFTRRSVLKSMAAVVAVAGASGCGSSSTDDVVNAREGLTYDKELKSCFSSGPYNCGAKCLHKIHYKNGKLYHLTSAGDIPREGSHEKDESAGTFADPIQRRACVRGYGYLQRLYQPDRLKYPLMRVDKNIPRGDPGNYKRVSWETAVNAAAEAIHEAIQRKADLGYSPIFCRWLGMFPFMMQPAANPCIYTVGNESTGAADGAKFDMLGDDAYTNNVSDRLNSDFIITWGLDPTRTTYYVEHSHWYNTLCKEDPNIDMVVITPNYSDAAGMLTTGVKNFSYTDFEGNIQSNVTIPGWIACRPTTDAALAVAMAYVIYKNNLYNHDYVDVPLPGNEADRKSFGFHPGDSMVSMAPSQPSETTLGGFINSKNLTVLKTAAQGLTDDSGTPISAGATYRGFKFTVPSGESFEEYLLSREVEWGSAFSSSTLKYRQPDVPATAGASSAYYGVLRYVEALTGVPYRTIEALAFKYAKPKPTGGVSFLDVGGGPQRAWNGVEWVQMMIALCTMTGFIDQPGGGAGFSMMGHSDRVTHIGTGLPPDPGGMLPNIESHLLGLPLSAGLYVSMSEWSNVAINGKDYRSRDRFIKEMMATSGVDVSRYYANGAPAGSKSLTDRLLEIDVWLMRSYNGIHTLENVNKIREAASRIKTIICLDQTMHPTAAHSDIIFPVNSHYETAEAINTPTGSTSIFKMDAPLAGHKLYDTKTDSEIIGLIQDRLNELNPDYAFFNFPSSDAATAYEGIAKSPLYQTHVDTENAYTKPTYEEFSAKGATDFVIPKGKSIIGMKHVTQIGKLCNSTGVVNFWQPLWGKIDKPTNKTYVNTWGSQTDGFRNPTACYQPNLEGFETFFSNGNPLTGTFVGHKSPFNGMEGWNRTYKLLYMTNKARNRAHTVFDNTAIIKDQFEQVVHMNPVDAAERGIKDGDMVYVYNDRGCTKIPARVTHYIVPGVISIEHGAWYRPHPTEKVWVWQDYGMDETDGETPEFTKVECFVDTGGCENMLTLGIGTAEHYCGQAVSAHGGPCEVSLTKPE